MHSLKSGNQRRFTAAFRVLRNTDLNAVGFFQARVSVKPVLIHDHLSGRPRWTVVQNNDLFLPELRRPAPRVSRSLLRATFPTLDQRQGIIGIPIKSPYTK
jgi:hypothetical protein